MKTVIAVFVIALVLAPMLSIQPTPQRTGNAAWAHWHASDSQWEAIYVAYNAGPPPPQPNDSRNCIPWNPWLCKGDRPPLRVM